MSDIGIEARGESTCTDLVRLIEWRAACLALDPEAIAEARAVEEKLASVDAGKMTMDEAFGPPDSGDRIRQRLAELTIAAENTK